MMSRLHRAVSLLTGALVLTTALAASGQPGAGPGGKGGKAAGQLATIRGVVAAVSGTTLALNTGSPGKEVRFAIDERTVVMTMKPMKRIAVTELRRGAAVTVSYAEEGGQAVAKRVWVRPPESEASAGGGKGKLAATR